MCQVTASAQQLAGFLLLEGRVVVALVNKAALVDASEAVLAAGREIWPCYTGQPPALQLELRSAEQV